MGVNGANIHIGQVGLEELNQQLMLLRKDLLHELEAKQHTIAFYQQEIEKLQNLLAKQESDKHLLEQLQEVSDQKMEGNKQLINKLLGQIDRLQQDIEWYKRTYVKRSLLGTIRQKLFGR